MSVRESVSNFFRYLVFFAFVIGVGIGGIYFYKRYKATNGVSSEGSTTEKPTQEGGQASTEETLPSQKLGPTMQVHLPVLLGPINGQPFSFGADFLNLESEIRKEAARAGKMRSAWNTAGAVCREIRALAVERNAVTAALEKGPPVIETGAAKPSKVEIANAEAKHRFFISSAKQRWATGTPQRKKKIEVLYRRMLAEESAVR